MIPRLALVLDVLPEAPPTPVRTIGRQWVHHPALGRGIATPEHLAGARVEEVRSEWNGGHHLTWYVLDRRGHQGDRIAVGGEDVTLEATV